LNHLERRNITEQIDAFRNSAKRALKKKKKKKEERKRPATPWCFDAASIHAKQKLTPTRHHAMYTAEGPAVGLHNPLVQPAD
jgi:hypothetical protein